LNTDTPLRVEERGEGRALVVLHGWQLSGEIEIADFEPAFDGADGWRRIYIDLPGMGKSNTPHAKDGISDIESMYESVVRAINATIGDEPFAVAGMSTGAELARGIAERLPERVLGLMLRVPRLVTSYSDRSVASDHDPAEVKQAPQTIAERRARDLFLDRDDPGNVPLPATYYRDRDVKRETWERVRGEADVAFLMTIDGAKGTYQLQPRPFSRFDKPTLIVVGRQDTRVGFTEALDPSSGNDALGPPPTEQYPRPTIVALDRAGHLLPVGRPDVFHALVRDWLWRIDEAT
jgi:pimeloyl-ACP methyl ester carboxylesterase